jgi:gas vesicle protein
MTGVVAGAVSSLYAERKLRRTVEVASARLQPDALVAGVGRSARQMVTSTGSRVRGAVASGREEMQRREVELWSELDPSVSAVDGAGADADLLPPTTVPLSTRRLHRSVRRSRSHLGK